MIELHRLLLAYLLNSVWQVLLIALVALFCSLLLRKANLAVQHRLWVGSLAVCVLLPLATASGWLAPMLGPMAFHSYPTATSAITLLLDGGSSGNAASSYSGVLFLAPSLANLLLMLWLGFVLFRAASLVWAWQRALWLVRDARRASISPDVDLLWAAAQSRFRLAAPRLLLSDRISAPATLNAPDPVLLLPSLLGSQASEAEFAAIFAHESAHIRRADFLLNLAYELLALPIAYHPATLFLRSRITESRELVCDQIAAASLGDASAYARSLVHIAAFLSQPAPNPTCALGIFEGRNLEKRIMTLLDRKPRLGRLSTALLVVLAALLFGSCCAAAAAFNFQPAAIVSDELKPYAGTWHWMFKGKPFVTMNLVPAGDHFTGAMTNGFFTNNESGDMIDAGAKPGTSPIVRTFFSGKVLHIVVQDDQDKSLTEWTMTLLSPDQAQFFTADSDAPRNLKPWLAERASETVTTTFATDRNGNPVYKIGGNVSAPTLLHSIDPEYPPDHQEKFTGVCIVSLLVDRLGRPQEARIVRSLGADFDRSALDAVKQYTFSPALLNGKPVAVSVNIEVNFHRY